MHKRKYSETPSFVVFSQKQVSFVSFVVCQKIRIGLKVLLNSTLKLYVLLKDLFSKTEELGSNLADFERGAKFLQGSLKRFLVKSTYVIA